MTGYDVHAALVRAVAGHAARRFRVPREDMVSAANLIFVEAVIAHGGRSAPFVRFLRRRLRRLADGQRRDRRRSRRLPRADADPDSFPGPYGVPRTADLGPDAAAVARAALFMPRMPAFMAKTRLRSRFVRKWGADRYAAAVAEIREVLE